MNHPDDAILIGVPPIFLCERCGGTSAHSPSGFAECRSCGWTRPGEGVRAALDAAKGCHGCRFSVGTGCLCPDRSPDEWIREHLSKADLMTPNPNAPECPGRVER